MQDTALDKALIAIEPIKSAAETKALIDKRYPWLTREAIMPIGPTYGVYTNCLYIRPGW